MGNIGFGELVVILLILLLVVGARRLPDIGRSLGRAVHEFRKGMNEGGEQESNKENDHADKT